MKNLLIIITLLSLTACYNDKEDRLYGNTDCNTENVSFSEDIMPIIKNSCATVGCHVQGGIGVGLFENYAQVKVKVEEGSFRQRVVVSKDMPPTGPLNDCQIEHIEQWLAEGALDN